MTERRKFVVYICVMSWSLLLLPLITLPLFSLAVPSWTPGGAWNFMSWPMVRALQPLLSVSIVVGYVTLFVLASASTAELVIAKWGVLQPPDDQP